MFIVFIIGTAGSGKSLLTATYSEWLKMEKQDVTVVNLDPGALKLPYSPDIDIRDYISVERIMDEYSLGPNGALIMAADLIAEEIDSLKEEIENLKSDIVLVDTSGQMEIFAFRASGPYIVQEISEVNKSIIYLFDAVFSFNPLNYVSNLFLSAAVYNRFLLPQLHLLSKCDLLPKKNVDKIVTWSSDPSVLEMEIEQKLKGTNRLLSRDMFQAIYQLGLNFMLVPISAKTNEGISTFNLALERMTLGKRFTD